MKDQKPPMRENCPHCIHGFSIAIPGPTYIHTYIHRHETDPLAGPHEITWLSGCAESPGHNGRPNLLGALVSWPACTEEPINWRARLRWSTLSSTPYANYRRELGDVRRHTLARLYSSSEQSLPRALKKASVSTFFILLH